jgi:hypothetical protein
VAAYRSGSTLPRSPVSSSIPQALTSAAAHSSVTNAPANAALRCRSVCIA